MKATGVFAKKFKSYLKLIENFAANEKVRQNLHG